jgi:hypothetical protein
MRGMNAVFNPDLAECGNTSNGRSEYGPPAPYPASPTSACMDVKEFRGGL